MKLRIQIIILICMALAFLHIINLIKKKRMNFRFGLGWLFIVLTIIVLAASPQLLILISNLLGIAAPVNMLFFIGFCFLLYLVFYMSMIMGEMSERIKQLSQEIAIIRKDMYDNYVRLEEKKQNK